MTPTQAAPTRRTPWLGVVALIAVVLPIAEIAVLVATAQRIGWWLLLILVLGFVLGGWVIRREGVRSWRALNAVADSATPTPRPLLDGALVLAGGVALAVPGLITDLIALILLLPVTRPLPRRILQRYLDRRFGRLRDEFDLLRARSTGSVIEGEVIEGDLVNPYGSERPPGTIPPRLEP